MVLDTQSLHRVVLHRMHFLVFQSPRYLDRIGLEQSGHDLLADIALDLGLGLALHVLADVLLELFDATFFDLEHLGQGIVNRRQDLLFDAMHLDREVDFLPRQILGVVVLRELHLEALLVACGDAVQPLLEVGQHLALPQHDRDLLALAALEGFALQRAVEIHDDTIAVVTLAIDLFPRRFLLAQLEDHLVYILLADRDVGLDDLDLVEVLEHDLGHDFESRDIDEARLVATGFGLDLRSAGGIQVLEFDGVRVALLHHLVQHFLANLFAVVLLDHLGRDLARPESLDLGLAPPRLEAVVDLPIDAFRRQLDPHAPFQRPRRRLDSNLHVACSSNDHRAALVAAR